MYVAPSMRGKGAADAIMDALEAEAQARGLLLLTLLMTVENGPAGRFYARRGFTPHGREPASHCVDGVAYDSFEMAKMVQPLLRAPS